LADQPTAGDVEQPQQFAANERQSTGFKIKLIKLKHLDISSQSSAEYNNNYFEGDIANEFASATTIEDYVRRVAAYDQSQFVPYEHKRQSALI
jgi:hypothetical protein